jgi:hypothetical protein
MSLSGYFDSTSTYFEENFAVPHKKLLGVDISPNHIKRDRNWEKYIFCILVEVYLKTREYNK